MIKSKGKNDFVLFGAEPLFDLGVHIGHLLDQSEFYARWFLKGVVSFYFFQTNINTKLFEKKNNKISSFSKSLDLENNKLKNIHVRREKKLVFFPVFIINLTKTIFGLRSVILMAKNAGYLFSTGWLVCHNHLFIPFTLRYALLLGMGYSIFDWISGCLTNFKSVFGLFFLIYREYMQGLILEKKHYIFLYRLLGFNLTGCWEPSFLFLPRMLESRLANYEGGCLFVQSVSMVDSNALSSDTLFPVVGNDDSFTSINFFLFIFSINLLKAHFHFLKKWKVNIRKVSKRKYFLILYYFTFFFRVKNYSFLKERFKKFFFSMFEKPFFFYDDKQIMSNLMPFGVFRFGIGCNDFNYKLMDKNLWNLR